MILIVILLSKKIGLMQGQSILSVSSGAKEGPPSHHYFVLAGLDSNRRPLARRMIDPSQVCRTDHSVDFTTTVTQFRLTSLKTQDTHQTKVSSGFWWWTVDYIVPLS